LLSKKITVALGIAALALAGAGVAAAAGGGGTPGDTLTSASARIAAEPSTAPSGAYRIPRCERGQASSLLISEIDPLHLLGKDSARTALAAVESANHNDHFDPGGEFTYERFGGILREGPRGYRHETWRARQADGKVRAYYSVAGGTPGGGWGVELFKRCTAFA
jgi:hypothetical protein